MASSAVMAKDHEALLHTAAVVLVRKRATSFLGEFGLLQNLNVPPTQVELLGALAQIADPATPSPATAGMPPVRRQAGSM